MGGFGGGGGGKGAKLSLALAASFAAGAGLAWALLRRRLGPRAGSGDRRQTDQAAGGGTHGQEASLPPRARVVPPPSPGWLPPDPQPMPFGEEGRSMIEIDPSATPKADVYALCISAVVPRPIALVSSVGPGAVGGSGGGAGGDGGGGGASAGAIAGSGGGADAAVNVAPYSYFNILSHDPPTVAIGMCRSSARGGARKDSFANIEATGEFVVNIISEWYVEAANHTCGDFPPGADEAAAAGLTPVPSVAVRAPRLAEAAVQMECALRAVHETRCPRTGASTGAIVIAEVVRFHVARAVAGRSPTGKLVVDATALRPVSRLGGVTYGRTSELYDLPRPGGDGLYAGGRKGPVAGG